MDLTFASLIKCATTEKEMTDSLHEHRTKDSPTDHAFSAACMYDGCEEASGSLENYPPIIFEKSTHLPLPSDE